MNQLNCGQWYAWMQENIKRTIENQQSIKTEYWFLLLDFLLITEGISEDISWNISSQFKNYQQEAFRFGWRLEFRYRKYI